MQRSYKSYRPHTTPTRVHTVVNPIESSDLLEPDCFTRDRDLRWGGAVIYHAELV